MFICLYHCKTFIPFLIILIFCLTVYQWHRHMHIIIIMCLWTYICLIPEKLTTLSTCQVCYISNYYNMQENRRLFYFMFYHSHHNMIWFQALESRPRPDITNQVWFKKSILQKWRVKHAAPITLIYKPHPGSSWLSLYFPKLPNLD